jgi:hypothetical protein
MEATSTSMELDGVGVVDTTVKMVSPPGAAATGVPILFAITGRA